MNSSFYNGISGVKTHQFGMDVWANNISNISTYGFRGSTPEFSSLFSTTLAGSYFDPTSNDKGLGSQSQTTALNLEQGILENTDRPFDLAISGEGWFAVQGQDKQLFYTRAGEFSIDKNGDLVDVNGHYLMATSGNNVTATSLSADKISQFGQYYSPATDKYTAAKPFAVTPLGDVPLGAVGSQTKVTLQDYLYFPPKATTFVNYQANLNPEIQIKDTTTNISAINSIVFSPSYPTASISGTMANNTDIPNLKAGDSVTITLQDKDDKTLTLKATLDANLNFSIVNADIKALDPVTIDIASALTITQEIPNVAHFTTGIIGPDGDRDIVDMIFTKIVPQPASGSTWDGVVKVLSFYKDYDPAQTYDPALYYVNTSNNKVYEIVDTQTGQVSFGGAGQLLSNTIPTLSNGGTPLSLGLGTPNSYTGLISSASIDKTNGVTSDGYVEGFLTGYGMDGYGNVIAEFSNGRSSAIAKVALYHFQNDQGLIQANSNYFVTSSNSGDPIFYVNADGESFLGSKIYSNKLEGSNVSMATALTELIIMQKAFDASAKSITTSDQMIQNAINMKK